MRILAVPCGVFHKCKGVSPTKTKKRQSTPFCPLATQGFRNVWNAPRVVIPPPPRTFRKYCAQSEKTATSPSCKQITQPSGAATPRDSDAHKRIAVPKALCVLCEHTRSRPKSGKIRRSGTRPGDVRERAERSEGVIPLPIRNAPCFAVCALVCDPLSKAECVPAFTCESERGPFCRRLRQELFCRVVPIDGSRGWVFVTAFERPLKSV